MKGISYIQLLPYDKGVGLIVVIGLTREELLEKINVSGSLYKQKAKKLSDIKLRKTKYDQSTDLFEKHNFPDAPGEANGSLCFDSANSLYFLQLRELDWINCTVKDCVEFMITMAHEVLHLCQIFLPKYLNRYIEQEGEAYFHSYIMDEIVDSLDNDYFW